LFHERSSEEPSLTRGHDSVVRPVPDHRQSI
jgi:hypothetical protein